MRRYKALRGAMMPFAKMVSLYYGCTERTPTIDKSCHINREIPESSVSLL